MDYFDGNLNTGKNSSRVVPPVSFLSLGRATDWTRNLLSNQIADRQIDLDETGIREWETMKASKIQFRNILDNIIHTCGAPGITGKILLCEYHSPVVN